MARSYVRQNVVNRFKLQLGSPECDCFEIQPRSGERSYDSLFFNGQLVFHSSLARQPDARSWEKRRAAHNDLQLAKRRNSQSWPSKSPSRLPKLLAS